MSSPLTFTSGFALNDGTAIAAGAGDSLPTFAKFTRIVEYSDSIDPHWWRHDQEWRASSISYFGPASEPEFDDFVVLSEEGNVRYVGDHAPSEEKIPNAGVFCEDAKGWGYLSDIQQVGERLYVCGYSGQVYRRNGPNNWTSIDGGLRQPPEGSTPEKLVRISLEVINGSDESAIYAAGYRHHNWLPPCAFYFNGSAWRALELPAVTERIVNMHVESEARIWMCGSNGTLLLGNVEEGFNSLSTVEDNQLFTSVCKYRDLIFLASNVGLFFYDPRKHEQGIQKVKTNLTPELKDANIVDSAGEVLWSIGPKDIARFDGKTWTRIDHPDNPPIR